ncbi:DUF1792 domain-containing protein [bacterium]|nr:DUF1792 domain-containing protein [bacterium]
MKALKTLINNIRYLCRYNLKEIFNNTKNVYNVLDNEIQNIHYSLDHIKYEITEDLNNLKSINIVNDNLQAINELIMSNRSFSRFGDGEVNLIFGNGIPFQEYDENLSNRLKEVLKSNNENLMLGIPNLFMSYEKVQYYVKKYDRVFYGKYTPMLLDLLSDKQIYYRVDISFPYINKGANGFNYDNYYSEFRKIWDKKDIVIVCGDRVFNNINYNIYDNASSINYIYAPTINAYKYYDKILNQIKTEENKNKIIMLILGPTATILAYDLCNSGYRALDLGHLSKDYDAYKKNIVSNTENITEFFNPD